ncbi:MAG: aminotransferase class V-fold PLP-dependent enzyme [Verrucomicrobia bacterium]|nr:aminotransferase class V-fold PLP-dependent enzyme [Verrucomicrobiota bacterium]
MSDPHHSTPAMPLADLRVIDMATVLAGPGRSPQHLAFTFAGLEAESLALVLDRVGLAVRGGSGCVTREMRIPPAMRAIGATPEEARALILFTLGLGTRSEQMQEAGGRVAEGVKRLEKALGS